MDHIEELYMEYARMRDNGLDTKSALNALRTRIEAMPKADREALAKHLRNYENGNGPSFMPPPPPPPTAVPEPPKPQRISLIRPIAPQHPSALPEDPVPEDSRVATSEVEQVTWVTCPNCGKANQRHEVFCYACGQLLEPVKGGFDTQLFDEPTADTVNKDYFGVDSVLALRVRGSTTPYELRPQNSDHELIIGRSTEGSAMAPDVDLKDQKGADLGVSRLHLSVRYDPENAAVLVADMGSANGSFINGQRMMSKEVRVLRHGDELRLGKLVMSVSFRHPGSTISK